MDAQYTIEFQKNSVDVAPDTGTWDPQPWGVPTSQVPYNSDPPSIVGPLFDQVANAVFSGYSSGDIVLGGAYASGLTVDYGGSAANFPFLGPQPNVSELFISCPTITVSEIQLGVSDVVGVSAVVTWDFTPDVGNLVTTAVGLFMVTINTIAADNWTPSGDDATDQASLQAVFDANTPGGTSVSVTSSVATVTLIGPAADQPIASAISSGTNQPVIVTQGVVPVTGQPEIQEITLSDGPDTGTFYLGTNVLTATDTAADVEGAAVAFLGAGTVTVSNDGGPWTVTWLSDGPVSTSTLISALSNINLTHTIACVVTQTQAGSLLPSGIVPLSRTLVIRQPSQRAGRHTQLLPLVQLTILPLRSAPRVRERRLPVPRRTPVIGAANNTVLILSPRIVR